MGKCTACGDKPRCISKDFTKAVIEIDNSERLVLLRKVVIPASLGDETMVPPTIGKYRNVILQYDMNDHIYIYSSDGIPTRIDAGVPQEIIDEITELKADVTELDETVEAEITAREQGDRALQQEIDDLKNSPDVVDVVATYAALQNYDTSTLTDKDVVRVLQDETHNNASTYYRWSTQSENFTYIGEVGSYYTKAQTDALLSGKQDNLTFDSAPTSGSNNPVTSQGIKTYVDSASVTFKQYPASVVTDGTTQQFISSIQALNAPVGNAYLGTVTLSDLPDGLIQEEVRTYVYSNNIIYCILYSADAEPYRWWCNSYDFRGWEPMSPPEVNVVQNTGTSTTDVMSQNAVTNAIDDVADDIPIDFTSSEWYAMWA